MTKGQTMIPANRETVHYRRGVVLFGICAIAVLAFMASVVWTGDKATLAEARGPLVPATNGRIAFIRSSEPSDRRASRIFTMNHDGTDQRFLAETTDGSQLAWSPDGRRLAFADVGGIYIINADGTGETRVATGSDSDRSPAWSPDGTMLAYQSLTGSDGGIYVIRLDGTGKRQLTERFGDADPAWSPDGTRIAFARVHFGEGGLFVMNADGSALTRLTPRLTGSQASTPTWSSDSRQIAFRRNSEVVVIDADGGAARTLASPGGTGAINRDGEGANKRAVDGGDPSAPRWSPDGSRIVYALYHSGSSCTVWVVNADGGDAHKLTDGAMCDHDPAWQPIPSA